MCAMAHTKYTPEALLAMPDGDQSELVDGELVARQIGFRSSRIGGKLFQFLAVHCDQHQLAWVLPSDAGYQCFTDDPGKVRKPDVSLIQAARLAVEDEPAGWARIDELSGEDVVQGFHCRVADLFAPPLG